VLQTGHPCKQSRRQLTASSAIALDLLVEAIAHDLPGVSALHTSPTAEADPDPAKITGVVIVDLALLAVQVRLVEVTVHLTV
jgi:hypothetical protein